MRIDEELFEIENQCDRVVNAILESETYHIFLQKKEELSKSEEAKVAIARFQEAKATFEQIEPYGHHAPGFFETRKLLFQRKREMDFIESVANYRVAERNFQVMLDVIAKRIAVAVSTDIIVSPGDAFSLSVIGLPRACEIHLGKRNEIEL